MKQQLEDAQCRQYLWQEEIYSIVSTVYLIALGRLNKELLKLNFESPFELLTYKEWLPIDYFVIRLIKPKNKIFVYKFIDKYEGKEYNTVKGGINMSIPFLKESSMISALVPISRFNKGEASKIFEEVTKGDKIVVKNNAPTCVLVDPKRYEDMVETLEDFALYYEAEQRLNNHEDYLSEEEVMKSLGIKATDLEDIDVEIV